LWTNARKSAYHFLNCFKAMNSSSEITWTFDFSYANLASISLKGQSGK
jgi:hypothetical protein